MLPRDLIHPKILKAMDAVKLPEVQEMMQRLANHGLAIAVPHQHGEFGEFSPLPDGKVGFEAGLQVSFKEKEDPAVIDGTPVMWRWDGEMKAVAYCYVCSGTGTCDLDMPREKVEKVSGIGVRTRFSKE